MMEENGYPMISTKRLVIAYILSVVTVFLTFSGFLLLVLFPLAIVVGIAGWVISNNQRKIAKAQNDKVPVIVLAAFIMNILATIFAVVMNIFYILLLFFFSFT
ncbi:hypothetical protein [Evansella tamaricis]|uniref:DUF4190 domain-containing protein n=1 Tax=Evansella tamaricis TaxID=2069301 RepID=A0ABS6J9G6_9BACI|nr:hypothetical protein [Evansella tamaricis]MBU9710327.1 hypothetical protein [Evansella tamaricis]